MKVKEMTGISPRTFRRALIVWVCEECVDAEWIKIKQIEHLIERYPALAVCESSIQKAVRRVIGTYEQNGTLLLCGNGGSCADAEHIAGELMKGFCKKRPLSESDKQLFRDIGSEWGVVLAEQLQKPLKAICLHSLPALSSAYANDVDPTLVYAQQAFAYAQSQDTLIGISTSGNAANVLMAAVAAKCKSAFTIGLTGADGGKMNDVFDLLIKVPETETYKVQELHLPVYHAMCLAVEEYFFDN